MDNYCQPVEESVGVGTRVEGGGLSHAVIVIVLRIGSSCIGLLDL